MSENFLVRLFEHNHWANQQIIKACAALTDAQLDAPPTSATYGSIRETLVHFVASQQSYYRTLTLSIEARHALSYVVEYAEVEASERASSEAFIALARDPAAGIFHPTPLRTRDKYYVEPFVVMVQAINHATEHREQIKSMITALGIEPPSIDGWDYGFATNTLVPIPAEEQS